MFYLFLLILLTIGFIAWKIMGPATAFEGKNYYLIIKTGSTWEELTATIKKDNVLASPGFFEIVAHRFDYPQKVKAGRYNIKNGMSLLNIIRILKNGQQDAVNLIITKLRTKEDLASLVGRKFECDSTSVIQFLNNNDTLKKYNLDSNIVMTNVFPNTYTYFWNTIPSRIFAKLRNNYEEFWTTERLGHAKEHGLNPQTAYILASIVEEETIKKKTRAKLPVFI